MEEKRIEEKQLVLPALYVMHQTKDGYISTSELIRQLEGIMHPTGSDAKILSGRKDTYFSQKVRNLKSHSTLEREEYAESVDNGFKLLPQGETFLQENIDKIDYLLHNDFSYADIKNSLNENEQEKTPLPMEEMFSEGRRTVRSVLIRERSSRLRQLAKTYFIDNKRYYCDCCGFNFDSFYGTNLKTDCIEIHHIRPIFSYEDEGIDKCLQDALPNLLPVCPNCHRIIHKNHILKDDLPKFKEIILQQKKALG